MHLNYTGEMPAGKRGPFHALPGANSGTLSRSFPLALGAALVVAGLLLAGCASAASESLPVPTAVPTLRSLDALAGTPQPTIPLLPPLDQRQVAEGQRVYAAQCASCHGPGLEGEADWQTQNLDGTFRAPPHDQSGHTWHHPDSQLRQAIQLGGSRLDPASVGGSSLMPAFAGTLSDAEIDAVLSYIKSTWPPDIRAIQWEQTIRQP